MLYSAEASDADFPFPFLGLKVTSRQRARFGTKNVSP